MEAYTPMGLVLTCTRMWTFRRCSQTQCGRKSSVLLRDVSSSSAGNASCAVRGEGRVAVQRVRRHEVSALPVTSKSSPAVGRRGARFSPHVSPKASANTAPAPNLVSPDLHNYRPSSPSPLSVLSGSLLPQDLFYKTSSLAEEKEHVSKPTRNYGTIDDRQDQFDVQDKIVDRHMIDFELQVYDSNTMTRLQNVLSTNGEQRHRKGKTILEENLATSIEHHIPTKKMKLKSYPAWFSKEIKRLIPE
ncbi:hypothetical protein FHG87_012823 [Trinorchestia longiramus]|nr:hypothetical protein FHG87_012823 [Trinorchestia longiramus]